MLGDFVSLIPKMSSSTEQGIIHSSTTTLAVSIESCFQIRSLEMGSLESRIMVLIVKTACNTGGGPENCQINMIDLEGTLTNINIYCLSTVGTVNMISEAGNSLAVYSDNVNVYPDSIALFKLDAGSGGSCTYILEVFQFLDHGRATTRKSMSHLNDINVELSSSRYLSHNYIAIGSYYLVHRNFGLKLSHRRLFWMDILRVLHRQRL
jgi:hypothetical protein